jgi:C-methyltransferase C-terminal domain/Methyltransferase domain
MPAEVHEEQLYPLEMLVCLRCWQVQIGEFPNQEALFADHPYVTGINVPVVRHFEQLVPHLIGKLKLASNDLALDVGCNDGSLLHVFKTHGLRVLGVDPSRRVGNLAADRGITVCRAFWNGATGKALAMLGLTPKIITATAVFYHVPNLHDFLVGLKEVMNENTVFVVQGVSLTSLLEKNEFDHFYHEHSCIHSATSLRTLLARHGLKMFDIEFSEIHGGSFIIYVDDQTSARIPSSAVEAALRSELNAGLCAIKTYHNFARRVQNNVSDLIALLHRLKQAGKTVYGLGAPVKGSTLLNYAGIGPDLVKLVTEVNSFKIGRLTPGTHIPIVDERELDRQPDYYLVLCWNFAEFLREKYAPFLQAGGRFIVPVPKVEIIQS